MGKMPAYIVERDKAFYQWLAVRAEEKLLVELYSVIPFINGYGKNRKCFNESLFELTESKSAQKLLDMIDGDKRFKFMHYGHTKKILMLLDSYCKYLEEKEGVAKKTSEPVVKAADDVQPAVEQPKVSEPALTASRAWSKYEVALLVETYLKAADNGYLRAAAEVLSHTLREWAVKQGKSIDATYRNVNGINMQLGTVQYCFTDGKKGLPNASTQIREMVNLYKTNRSEYEIVLTQAHQMLNKPGNEVAVLLQLPEYAPLRDELLKNGITTIEQLKAIDLWLFMNRHGVYSIRERQEIYKRVSAMIKPPESEKVRVQYFLRTKNGRSYYGNMPSTALASYIDSIAQNEPLSVRKLIDQRNNGIGQIALYSSIPPSGGIALANVRAYLDKAMTAKVALQHALWLGDKLKLTDLPVAIEENGQSVATAEAVSETKPEVQKTAETKQKKETGLQDYVKLYAGKTGEDWLFSMLSALKIKSEDKRKNQGCLWISGGHELDEFIKLCTAKGYKFHYKADGYKAFSGGPVWWTTDCVASVAEKVKVATIREVVIRVLTENNRPMTTREIYTEIEKRGLYKFSSGNPCMIVDHTIRKSCVGIKMPNHTQDDVFDRVLDDSGVSKYYLLEWGKTYPDGESEVPEIEGGNNDAKPEYDDNKPATRAVNRWEEILSRYFPDGYIPDDFLSQLQAKTYWQEAYGEDCPLDGAAIDEAIKACGTVRDGRVFVASEEEQGLITEMVAVILGILDKYSAVYRKNIYDRYEDKLAKCSIYTEEVMEQQLLEEAKGKFLCLWKFFVRKGHEPAIALDCRKVLRNHGGAMPAADVQKVLWFMPGELVYHTLSTDKEALSLGNGVWMLAEHFPLTEEEAALIGDALDEYFIAHDFIQAADLLSYFQNRLPAIADNLKGLHFSAVFGIVKYYLGKRFSFTRAIISPLGAKIDFTDLFRNYASEHDQFTMDELAAFAKEIQIPIYFESLYSGGTVRINADEFVHKSKVSFDIEETDKVLESICPGDYMPFYAVSNAMLMHMPPCGYQWNGYLLLNYVYSFSKIFRASYKSIGKTGYYGAMVRRDCGTISNFRQLLVRVLTDDDTWKTVDDARELIVKRGYQALKDIGGIDKIVAQARENKLKDRG